MSDLNTKATVTLQVNGQQAQQTLQNLKNNALQLETAMAKAAAAGNKTDLKRLRKELGNTRRQIRELESSTMQVENVMRRLDKAAPKELNKTLQTLNKQLEYMERGSAAWNGHIEKIRKVKAEIALVSKEMRGQESWFSRMNRVVNDWQTTIMGAAAALTGLIYAGRKAVKTYAEMDEHLANTRKYTGMTVEEVEELNDSFKKMDTRTSREQLNLLAQEAGRLGKTSMEDVKGYVEASDIINVALVDLGEGATQTIAKLSNIFRVEEELGTKDSMLAVGSAVNVLSQNCTASKKYLVEFTQRMAGVGAQAGLTIPQLLAFGATLDANGQKTEMSASALGKLTMMLFQKPGEVAQQVGLDVQAFSDALKRSTNEGLMMFLEKIRALGSKDGLAVLAPLFKDLGMDGVRMSQVLATLAEHLDMVKWEQEEANKAFKEATSATHEYEIFNNTVQASLDKARKRVTELAIELGEKLLPVMSHVIRSTTLTMRALNAIVDFIIEHKTAILVSTAAIVAYNVAVNASNIALKVHYGVLVVAKAATIGWQKAVVLARIAFYAFTGQTTKATAAVRLFNITFKTTPWGWIVAGITAVVGALVALYSNTSKVVSMQKKMNEVEAEAAKNTNEEVNKINMLNSVLHDNSASLGVRKNALDELKKIVPDYLADLDSEGNLINDNTSALDKYIKMLRLKAQVSVASQKLAETQTEYDKWYADLDEGTMKRYAEAKGYTKPHVDYRTGEYVEGEDARTAAALAGMPYGAYAYIEEMNKEFKKNIADYESMMQAYSKELAKIEAERYVPSSDGGGDDESGNSGAGGVGDSSGSGKNGKADKFSAETDWKKTEEAKNRIAYAKGEKDYIAYQERMLEIEVEYGKRMLAHTDLTESERLGIEADYYEALKKQSDAAHGLTIEEENKAYSDQLAIINQRYVDGKMSTEVYEETIEMMEMEHLRRLVALYEDGSKEQLDVKKRLQDMAIANQKAHQKEYEKNEKEHQDALAKLKNEFFGDNPQERQAKYDAEMALLSEVFNAEIAAAEGNAEERLRIEEAFQKAKLALQEQYDIESEESNRNFLKSWNNDLLDFLDSDVGEAIRGSLDVLSSSMSSIFQGLTSIVQSELEIQTAAIESRYEKEISLAEGNNYKVKKLEKAKEAEIAKAKNEANKKMFAMQVMQAVAQTATSAINAYSSAAAVPVVGYILAPIAAASAVAAGAIQIAAIKKQQQASVAQGYSAGGFTPEGKVDEAVGVVHAGEWVASQKLTKNPKTRPLLEALEYAQSHNAIGSLRTEDVSSSITAPVRLANVMQSTKLGGGALELGVGNDSTSSRESVYHISEYTDTLKRLAERLEEPFITVNTVTGDFGSKKAMDDYEKLISNKSPKSRK